MKKYIYPQCEEISFLQQDFLLSTSDELSVSDTPSTNDDHAREMNFFMENPFADDSLVP